MLSGDLSRFIDLGDGAGRETFSEQGMVP